jgi:copper(I)-binding protein
MVRMQPLGPLTIPAGRSLVLEPGGVHVMLGGIKPTVSPGDSLSLTLKFDGRDDVTVAAPVRSYASEEQ